LKGINVNQQVRNTICGIECAATELLAHLGSQINKFNVIPHTYVEHLSYRCILPPVCGNGHCCKGRKYVGYNARKIFIGTAILFGPKKYFCP